MATKDVTDKMVCAAVAQWRADRGGPWPYEILMSQTGEPFKVCYRAMERCDRHGFIEYGVSLRTSWLTPDGEKLLNP